MCKFYTKRLNSKIKKPRKKRTPCWPGSSNLKLSYRRVKRFGMKERKLWRQTKKVQKRSIKRRKKWSRISKSNKQILWSSLHTNSTRSKTCANVTNARSRLWRSHFSTKHSRLNHFGRNPKLNRQRRKPTRTPSCTHSNRKLTPCELSWSKHKPCSRQSWTVTRVCKKSTYKKKTWTYPRSQSIETTWNRNATRICCCWVKLTSTSSVSD